jgi:hypothetical protein
MRFLVAALVALVAVAACGSEPAPSAPSSRPPPSAAAGSLLFSCGELPFDPAVLAGPGGAEQVDDPLAAALRRHLGTDDLETNNLPDAGWILVGMTPLRAEFVARDRAGDWWYVGIANSGSGWEVDSWGGCVPHAVLPGLNLAEWVLDPDVPPPGPDAATFGALVTERACASGKPMGDRLQPPFIAYGEAEVIVVFGARPQRGGQDCQGNPPSAVTVDLREPLGDRRLVDGSVFPPADAARPRP